MKFQKQKKLTRWGKMIIIFGISILQLTKITSNGKQQRTNFFAADQCYQKLFFMQKNKLQSFDKNHKIVVLHHYHENSDKIFLRYCQHVDEEAKRYRDILRKWYV